LVKFKYCVRLGGSCDKIVFMKRKIRIDQLLLESGLFESRAKAQAAILSGIIYVGEEKIDKPGKLVAAESKVDMRGTKTPFVSRGGEKLDHAIKEFGVDVKNKVCIDIGASTGGFTDCLLQNGAKLVFCIDVGYGQLAWKLQKDPRVIISDRTNARYLTAEKLYPENSAPRASLAVMDVSFISILKILPAVYNLLEPAGEVVSLVKPQFEAGKDKVEKGGLVKNTLVHQEVLDRIKAEAAGMGFIVSGETASPIKGRDGNTEFFIYLKKNE
jgi:23S rRNA (cytidine1920-2'-O)/16S rRNA (cytidine1409-2'-O)-methyltransferase